MKTEVTVLVPGGANLNSVNNHQTLGKKKVAQYVIS